METEFVRKNTYVMPEGFREKCKAALPVPTYRNNVTMHPEAYLSDSCWIVGDVRLGYHAVIFHGASLRGDSNYIEIGAESNIQELCILHESPDAPIIIGEHTTVGHGAILHGCTIGDNSLIGMNAVVLDRATIGNNCIVAAGAVVSEGMVVPDFSMVAGVPAKIKKTITQADVERIIEPLSEDNLNEAANLLEAGLMFHPCEEVFRKIGILPEQ